MLQTRQAHKHLSVKPAWAPQGRVNVVWPAGQQVGVRAALGQVKLLDLGWGRACRGIVQGGALLSGRHRSAGVAGCSTAGLFLQGRAGRLCVADCVCMGARSMRHAGKESQRLGCLHLAPNPRLLLTHLLVAPMTSTCPLSISPSMSASSTLTMLAKIWSDPPDLRGGRQAAKSAGRWRRSHISWCTTPALGEAAEQGALCHAVLCCVGQCAPLT